MLMRLHQRGEADDILEHAGLLLTTGALGVHAGHCPFSYAYMAGCHTDMEKG